MVLSLRLRPTTVLGAAPLLLSACAVPTDLPVWDTAWTASAGQVSFVAADLLPSNVVSMSETFAVPVFPDTETIPLSRFCDACEAGPAPKRAFDSTVEYDPPTPAEIVGGTVIAGEVRFRIGHMWGFDPLRPGGEEVGSISVAIVREDGFIFGSTTLDGGDTDFPSGSSRELTVTMSSGDFGSGVVIAVRVASPAGDVTDLDPTQELSVSVLLGSVVTASAIDIAVGDDQVESSALQFDLSEVDSEVEGKVQSGVLVVLTNNTFDIGIGGAIALVPEGGLPIVKALSVPKGQAEQRLSLSREEVNRLLGSIVNVRARGTVEGGTDAVVRIVPQDRLDFKVDLELVVRIGG